MIAKFFSPEAIENAHERATYELCNRGKQRTALL